MSGPLVTMRLSEWLEWLDEFRFEHPKNLAEAIRLYEDSTTSTGFVLKPNKASSTRVQKTLLRIVRGLLAVAYKWNPGGETPSTSPNSVVTWLRRG